MPLQLRSTDDGHMYEVCLEEDGITECTFVSSLHLVEDKERQLREVPLVPRHARERRPWQVENDM